MPSEIKTLMAEELSRRYPSGTDYLVVGYTKLTGVETTALRRTLRERGVRMNVVKNRIAARALAAGGLGEGARFLRGPSALFSGDIEMPELCRIVKECREKLEKKLLVRGGMMNGAVLMPEIIGRLASIPPLPVLHAQIAGSFQAPIAGAAAAFQSLLRSLARALEGIRKEKEGDSSPSAPATAASEGFLDQTS